MSVGGQLKFSNAVLLIVRKCFYLGESCSLFGKGRELCLNKQKRIECVCGLLYWAVSSFNKGAKCQR